MQTIGPYRIAGEIARGGMGAVYRARGPQGEDVALKLLHQQLVSNPKVRRRFELEAAAMARLQHPNLVRVLGAGEHRGGPWLALEFVEGESLQQRLRLGPLPIADVLRIAHQLAQALAYIHAQGVLHRDVKPDNVLLRGEQALLTDFGLALESDASYSRLTATGVFLGTPGYWAPEQATGSRDEFGPHTDLYGLGALLYACLTGQAPVRATTLQEFLLTESFKQIPPPNTLRAEVPEWLNRLCMRCLAVECAQRPESADAVARELAAVRAVAPREGARRARWPLAVLGGVVLLLAGASAWAFSGVSSDPAERVARLTQEGYELTEAKRYDVALERFAEALRLDPQSAEAYVKRARTLILLRRFEDAVSDCTQGLGFDPELREAFLHRGTAFGLLGRHEEARADYQSALRFDPNDAAVLTSLAYTKCSLGRRAEAIEDFDLALRLDPESWDAYAKRGETLAMLGRNEEAIADCTRSLELKPSNPRAHAFRGSALAQLGRFAEAIEDFDVALRLEPGNSATYSNRGFAKANLGRDEEAIEDYDSALRLDSKRPLVYLQRGGSKSTLGLQLEALDDYAEAIRLDPTAAQGHALRGLVFTSLERLPEAIAEFDAALKLDPKQAMIHVNRGIAFDGLGRYQEALADFDQALQLGVPERMTARLKTWRAETAANLGQE